MPDGSSKPSHPSPIEIPLAGRSVSRCIVDSAFTLEFLQGGQRYVLRIGGRFRLRLAGADTDLDAERLEDSGRAVVLTRKTVETATAHWDGTLQLKFSDGTILTVPPDPQYESWEAWGEDGSGLVSTPGDGLVAWSPPRRPPKDVRRPRDVSP